jgi:uncharacterized membrane protein YesL
MWRERLTEFGDCLQVGMLVCLASLPVVTAGPAFAAGCAVVSRWRDGESPPMVPLFRGEFTRQLRGGVPFTIAAVAIGLLVSVDLALLGTELPGHGVLSAVLPFITAVLVVLALRTCSVVSTHDGWLAALRAAARLSLNVRGSALLAAAVVTAGVLVWMQPLMLLVVAGPLTLAAVGTSR